MSNGEERLTELLSVFLDGEVSPRERARAEELLRTDREARALYAKLEKTRGLLNGLERLSAPRTLEHRVLHQLKMSRGRPDTFFGRVRRTLLPARLPTPLFTYAGALLIIVAVVYISATGIFFQPEGASPSGQLAAAKPGEKEIEGQDLEEQDKYALTDTDAVGDAGAGAAGIEGKDESKKEETDTYALMRSGAGEAAGDEAMLSEPAAEAEAPAEVYADRADAGMIAAEEAPPPESRLEMARRAAPAQQRGRSLRAGGVELPLGYMKPVLFNASEKGIAPSRTSDDLEAGKDYYVSKAATHVAERGAPRQLDPEAFPGSDYNPLFDPRRFSAPRLLSFEFIGRGAPTVQQEVTVFVQAHIAGDGSILYLRLAGRQSARQLIEDLADRLIATRLIPARVEQVPVSVFYSFVVAIRPAQTGATLTQ